MEKKMYKKKLEELNIDIFEYTDIEDNQVYLRTENLINDIVELLECRFRNVTFAPNEELGLHLSKQKIIANIVEENKNDS